MLQQVELLPIKELRDPAAGLVDLRATDVNMEVYKLRVDVALARCGKAEVSH